MQKRNDILNELLEISRLIAEINNKNNLYGIPAGYFESFADILMNRIKNNDWDSVKHEMEILSPVLFRIEKKNFANTVPNNYFETFPEKILARLKAEQAKDASEELAMLSPLLSKADKNVPYTAPEGYFNQLSGNLAAGMKAITSDVDESAHMHPLMRDLKNKSVYTVPEEYFNHLPEIILDKVKKQPAKIVSFKINRSWLKYAVAAAVTGVILTIGLFTFNNNTTDDPATGLSKISDQEMTNYLNNHDVPSAAITNSTATLDFNDNDVRELLGDVPDNELEQYANNHNGPKDLITN